MKYNLSALCAVASLATASALIRVPVQKRSDSSFLASRRASYSARQSSLSSSSPGSVTVNNYEE